MNSVFMFGNPGEDGDRGNTNGTMNYVDPHGKHLGYEDELLNIETGSGKLKAN